MKILKRYKKRLFWCFTGFCFGLSPYIFYLAEMERGYKAIGGEVFIFVVPFLVWLINKEIIDSLKKAKRTKRNTYKTYGCKNRTDYLYCFEIKYNLNTKDVIMYAEILSITEDYDALPIALEEVVYLKIS